MVLTGSGLHLLIIILISLGRLDRSKSGGRDSSEEVITMVQAKHDGTLVIVAQDASIWRGPKTS